MQWVLGNRENLKELFANGNFAASLDAEFIARHAGAQGACSAYNEILELTYKDLELDNDK